MLTLYTKSFPIEIASHILDLYILFGEFFLFRVALGVLSYFEDAILACDFEGTIKLLKNVGQKVFPERMFLIAAGARKRVIPGNSCDTHDGRRIPAIVNRSPQETTIAATTGAIPQST